MPTTKTTIGINWVDRYEQLSHLGEKQLYELARNASAPVDYRRWAIEVMQDKGYASGNLAEFDSLKLQVPKPEPEIELPKVEFPTGPLVASVTTKTMAAVEVIPDPLSPSELSKQGLLMVDSKVVADPNKTVQKMETDGKA